MMRINLQVANSSITNVFTKRDSEDRIVDGYDLKNSDVQLKIKFTGKIDKTLPNQRKYPNVRHFLRLIIRDSIDDIIYARYTLTIICREARI